MTDRGSDNQWLEAIAKQQELANKLARIQIEATENNTKQIKIVGSYVICVLCTLIAIFFVSLF